MKKSLNVQKITAVLDGHHIEYTCEDDKIVIRATEGFEALRASLRIIQHYYVKPNEISMQEVMKNGKLTLMEIEIPFPTSRQKILEKLCGKEYVEEYGKFTTSDGEVFFSDEISEEINLPDASLYHIMCLENSAKNRLEEAIDDLIYSNRMAASAYKDSINEYERITNVREKCVKEFIAASKDYNKKHKNLKETLKALLHE